MSAKTNYDAFAKALPELTSLFYAIVQPGVSVGEVPFTYIKALGLTQNQACEAIAPYVAGFFKSTYNNLSITDILIRANAASNHINQPFAGSMDSLYTSYYIFREQLDKLSGGYSNARQEGTLRFVSLIAVLIMNQEYALEKLAEIPLYKKSVANLYNVGYIWQDARILLEHLKSRADAGTEPVLEIVNL